MVRQSRSCVGALSAGEQNALRQYWFVVGKFGFGNMVFGGLCVMRSNGWGGSEPFSWAIHCGNGGLAWEGLVCVEVFIVTVCVMFRTPMGERSLSSTDAATATVEWGKWVMEVTRGNRRALV